MREGVRESAAAAWRGVVRACAVRLGSLALAAVVLASVAALGFIEISSADTGFHLATGRLVLETRAIPAENALSFTEPRHAWILHEWLSATTFELAWRLGGPTGLLCLKELVLVATFGCVLAICRRLGASKMGSAAATLLAAWASAARFTERPQLYSNLLLAASLLAAIPLLVPPRTPSTLVSSSTSAATPAATPTPTSAATSRIRVLAVGLALAVGLQLHGGAVNALLTFVAMAGGEGLAATFARPSRETAGERSRTRARLTAAAHAAAPLLGCAAIGVALGAAALLAYHPHGAAPLLVPFDLGTDPELASHVVEYRPPHTLPFEQTWPFWLLAAFAVPGLALARRSLAPGMFTAALLWLGLSLRYARVVDSAAVALAPVVALGLSRVFAGLARRGQAAARPATLRFSMRALALVALAVGVVGGPAVQWQRFPRGPGINRRVWPTDLFAHVRREGLVGPAFVSDGWAGPFLAEFFPSERAFFDPRFEAYSREFVEQTYRAIRYAEPGWDAALERYGVELVLLKYTSAGEAQRQRGAPNLRQALVGHPSWALVGFGDYGELFVKNGGANAAHARANELPGVDPDRASFVGRAALAAGGLAKLLDRGWRDTQVLVLAAVALADAGENTGAERLIAEARAREPDDSRVAAAAAICAKLAGRAPP